MSELIDELDKNQAISLGDCFVSKMITEQSKPVVFMYRDKPDQENDSGWVFLSGEETVEYIKDTNNLSKQNITRIVALDPSVQNHLNSPYGTGWKRSEGNNFEEIKE